MLIAVARTHLQVTNRPLDLLRFVLFGQRLHQNHEVAFGIFRPERFVQLCLIVLDDRVRHPQDTLGRSVILFEPDDRRLGIIPLKRKDVSDVGPAKSVNTLRVVADDAQVFVLAGEKPGHDVLGVIRVLILVDVDVFPAVAVFLEHVRMLVEKADRLDEQVVEIQRVRPAQHLFVRLVQRRGTILRQRICDAPVFGRRDELILRARNQMSDAPWTELLRIHVVAVHQLADDPLGVVGVIDAEIGRVAQLVALHTQQASERRMERTHPDASGVAASHQPFDSLLHLARCLVRERKREDFIRTGPAGRDQIGDPVGQRAGLSGSGTRNDQDGPFRHSSRLLLRRIQPLENPCCAVTRSVRRWGFERKLELTHVQGVRSEFYVRRRRPLRRERSRARRNSRMVARKIGTGRCLIDPESPSNSALPD